MSPDQINVLEMDAAKGDRYQVIYDEMIVPFFEAKQIQFMAAFQDVGIGDSGALASLHSQSKALDALRSEFEHYINTGKIAKTQLQRA